MSKIKQLLPDAMPEPQESLPPDYQAHLDSVEQAFDDGLLDEEYGEYIMNNCHGERVIGNGDALIIAMEQGYLYNSFIESRMI